MVTSSAPARQRYARGEGERLRQDLLDAAVELMATHGRIESITLRAVAREVGVSPAAVYRHFDDHLDLLREAVEMCWQSFLAALEAGRAETQDPFDALGSTGDAYARFATENPGKYRVLFASMIDVGMPEPEAAGAAFQVLVDVVAGVLEARSDDRDPVGVAMQVHTWTHGIMHLRLTNPGFPWPPLDQQMADLAEALDLLPR